MITTQLHEPCAQAPGSELCREANPAAWGNWAEVVVPCRKRRSIWNNGHCCRREYIAALSDSEIETQFGGCFQGGSADEIRYAMETCCVDDETQAISKSYEIYARSVHLASCLTSNSPSNASDYTFIFTCEKLFLDSVLEMFKADLPEQLKKQFRIQHGKISKRSLPILVEPLNPRDYSLRYALRLLENLLIPPELTSFDQTGKRRIYNVVEALSVAELHANLTAELQETRLKQLPAPPAPPAPADSSVVHLAMVASIGSPPYGRYALATLRSALFHAKQRKLHFHLFVDKAGWADVEEAMEHLEPWLRLRLATVDYYGLAVLKKFWKVLKRYVPQSCISKHGEFGWLGWMRLFSHEVPWKADIEDLIWVDAGDFLFFADPSLLLDQHREALDGKGGAIVSHPSSNIHSFAFNLPKMREAKWTRIFGRFLSFELRTNRSGGHDAICQVGGFQRLKDLRPRGSFKFAESQMWNGREHPGLIDATRAFVFCPTLIDWFAHGMAAGMPPFFVVEIAQAFEYFSKQITSLLNHGFYSESPSFGDQDLQHFHCGRPILAMHLIRHFHTESPWGMRLLDFWSNAPGLWGGDRKAGYVLDRRVCERGNGDEFWRHSTVEPCKLSETKELTS
eukprot:Skav203279  [mRNA]  locus=scaffold324:167979:172217:+ [translate_table: standard]